MSYADDTLNGLLQMNDRNLADINVTNLLQDAPMINRITAVPASENTVHKYLKQSVAAGAGFRAIGAGITNVAGEETLVTDTLQLLDASWNRDKALGIGYRMGLAAYAAKETTKSLKSAFATAEKQLIYGTGNDAAGFVGLANQAGLSQKDDTMVVDAGGSSAGAGTSVWLIRSDVDNIAMIAGNNGKIEVGDIWEGVVLVSTALMSCVGCNILGYLGLQIGSAYSAARICNITDQSGKTLSDSLISQALQKFPSARPANWLVMNRRALGQLQRSRTATSPTGAPAPFPDSAFGVPIIVTDSVKDTETILTT